MPRMTRILIISCFLLGCGSKAKPAPTTTTAPDPAPTETQTAGKTCDLDTPGSCPEGQTCKVPDGQPTRTGTCE